MPLDVYVDPSTGKIYWNDGSTESIAIDGNTANTLQIVGYSGQFSPGSTPAGATSLVVIKDNAGTDALTPGTTGYELGSSTLRWKLFATTGDFNSTVTAPTFSGTATTARNIDIASAGNTDFIHYILFSRFETGTGLAVSSSIGLSYNPSSRTLIGGTFQGTFSGTLIGTFSGTATTSTNLHVNTGAANSSHRLLYSPQGNGIGIAVSSGAGLTYNPNTGMLTAGELTLLDNVNSTSTTSGALIITGGVGVGGTINIGQRLAVSSTLNSSSTTTGAIVNSGGLGMAGNAFIGGTVVITNTTNSSTINSGALEIDGGVGVGQSVSIGGRLQIFNGTNAGYAAFRYTGAGNTVYTLPNDAPVGIAASFLSSDVNGNLNWIAPPAAGSGNPGGSDTQIQYNNGGSFGGAANFIYDDTTSQVSIATTSWSTNYGDREPVLILVNTDSAGAAGSRFSPILQFRSEGIQSLATSDTEYFHYNVYADAGGGSNYQVSKLRFKFARITDISHSNPPNSNFKDILVLSNKDGVGVAGTAATNVNYFKTSNTQSSDKTYILPTDYPATGTSVLSSNTTGTLSWIASSGGSGGSPAGNNTEIQFNDGGSFGGATGFTYDKTNNIVTISTNAATGTPSVNLRLKQEGQGGNLSPNRYSPAIEMISRVWTGVAANENHHRYKFEVIPRSDTQTSQIVFKSSIDQGTSNYYTGNLFAINIRDGVGIGNTKIGFMSYLKASDNQAADKTYILPTDYPTTGAVGTSVLSSDTSGNLNWVAMSGGGPGGSGTVNSGTGGSVAYYPSDGTAVSGSATITMIPGTGVSINSNINVRSGNELRISPTSNAAYTAIKSETTSTHTLTLPTAQNSSIGSSYLTVDTVGRMSYQPAVRKRSHRIQFGAALNPVAGADVAEFEIPYVGGGSGFTTITYRMLRAHARVGTASAIGSSFYIQKYAFNNGTGVSAFDVSPTSAAGSTFNILASPLIIQGDTTYESSTSSFAGAHITAVSGDKLRLFWLQASNTQYNFSISLYMEEDVS